MTGVLAQLGSFFDVYLNTPVAHAATEAAEHAGEAAAEHAAPSIHVVLKAEEVFNLLGFPITNSLIMTAITTVVLLAFAWMVRSKLAMIPGKLQAGVEMLFEGVLNYMAETLESESLARKFFPLVMTIFLFVLVANELAFLPGVGSILVEHGGHMVPLLRAPAADLNMTLALAIIAFLVIEITGVVVLGFFKYAGKYINFSSPVNFVVGIIELLSNIGRLISFSFRLFGNVFAGEVMIAVALFFVAYLLPVPLMAFEVFVAFIQAVVFAMLTLFFIKLSIMEPHGDEAH
jgi:F-type H+-transporting ATPase subunit a